MKRNLTARILALVGVSAVLGLFVPSSYGTLSYTADGTTVGGNTVDATADISVSGNTVTVTLTDLLPNPSSVASLLNGIMISIDGATGASGLTANNATIVNVSRAHGYTTMGVNGGVVANQWGLSGSSTITLSALATGPNYLIIGPPPYSHSNSSIAGNGPHNPFLLENETFSFTLNGSGPFDESDITGITFLFGTGCDYFTVQQTTVVPEASTVLAGAVLLVPLGIQTFRQLRRRRADA